MHTAKNVNGLFEKIWTQAFSAGKTAGAEPCGDSITRPDLAGKKVVFALR